MRTNCDTAMLPIHSSHSTEALTVNTTEGLGLGANRRLAIMQNAAQIIIGIPGRELVGDNGALAELFATNSATRDLAVKGSCH